MTKEIRTVVLEAIEWAHQQSLSKDFAEHLAERVANQIAPAWPRLSAEDHGDLRRVRAIIQRLHHRERGEWGEPLNGCLDVLARIIDNTAPESSTKGDR